MGTHAGTTRMVHSSPGRGKAGITCLEQIKLRNTGLLQAIFSPILGMWEMVCLIPQKQFEIAHDQSSRPLEGRDTLFS